MGSAHHPSDAVGKAHPTLFCAHLTADGPLQRFLKKHGLTRSVNPILPPNKPIDLRFKFEGDPHQHAPMLMQLARQLEADGHFVKARDALHDLYMIDPSHTGVFRRARMLESQPDFQRQLRASIAERRQLSFGEV